MWDTQHEVLYLARQHPNFQQWMKSSAVFSTPTPGFCSHCLSEDSVPLHVLEGKPQKTFRRQNDGISAQVQ